MCPSLAALVLLAASLLAPRVLQDLLPSAQGPLSAPQHLLAAPNRCLRTPREPVAIITSLAHITLSLLLLCSQGIRLICDGILMANDI